MYIWYKFLRDESCQEIQKGVLYIKDFGFSMITFEIYEIFQSKLIGWKALGESFHLSQ